MNRLNPDKFLREIDTALELIEEDFSKSGTISNIIDRTNRSMLLLLRSIVENSKERVINDEIKELKEQVLRSQVEITRLKKRVELE